MFQTLLHRWAARALHLSTLLQVLQKWRRPLWAQKKAGAAGPLGVPLMPWQALRVVHRRPTCSAVQSGAGLRPRLLGVLMVLQRLGLFQALRLALLAAPATTAHMVLQALSAVVPLAKVLDVPGCIERPRSITTG